MWKCLPVKNTKTQASRLECDPGRRKIANKLFRERQYSAPRSRSQPNSATVQPIIRPWVGGEITQLCSVSVCSALGQALHESLTRVEGSNQNSFLTAFDQTS